MMSNEEKILTAELMGLSYAVEKAAGNVYTYISNGMISAAVTRLNDIRQYLDAISAKISKNEVNNKINDDGELY